MCGAQAELSPVQSTSSSRAVVLSMVQSARVGAGTRRELEVRLEMRRRARMPHGHVRSI